VKAPHSEGIGPWIFTLTTQNIQEMIYQLDQTVQLRALDMNSDPFLYLPFYFIHLNVIC